MKIPQCHPERLHKAKGLCVECYRLKNKERNKEIWKEYYLKYKGRLLNKRKEYYLKNKEHILKFQKEYHLKYKECRKKSQKESDLKRRYGLTLQELLNKYELQNKKCAICMKEIELNKNLNVDHIKNTKIVRGILCSQCNMGLGQFKDSIINLENAIRYLKI